MRILDVVTLEEYRRLVLIRRACALGHFDEFLRYDTRGRRVCRLGDVRRCGVPNWRTTEWADPP